jgi:hypothetical protein
MTNRVYAYGIPGDVVGRLLQQYQVEMPINTNSLSPAMKGAFVDDPFDALILNGQAPKASEVAQVARRRGAQVIWFGYIADGLYVESDEVVVEPGQNAAQTMARSLGLRRRSRAVFVPVVSGKGGVGKSTLAAYTALALARQDDLRVLLVDDSSLGQVAGFFGHEGKGLSYIGQSNNGSLRSAIVPINERLDILPILPLHATGVQRWPTYEEAVDILNSMTSMGYDLVVIDVRPEVPIPERIVDITPVSLAVPLLAKDAFMSSYIVPYTPTELGVEGAAWARTILGDRVKFAIPVVNCVSPDQIPEAVEPPWPNVKPVVVPYSRTVALTRQVATSGSGIFSRWTDPSKHYDGVARAVRSMAASIRAEHGVGGNGA